MEQHELATKWDKFMLRMKQVGNGKAAVVSCVLILDRNGELETWSEPKCTKLEHVPASLGILIKKLLENG